MTAKTILIMAGGTGGHVFPGLAVADYLRKQGHNIAWLGTQHGLDTTLVPKANIPLYKISMRGLRGKGKFGLLLAPFKIFKAILESLSILKKVKPDVVLGMGGYVAAPGGIACWLKRIPLIVHEQNAIPGKTNLILSRFAKVNLEAFPKSLPIKAKAHWVGNPIRKAICDLPKPLIRIPHQENKLNVLVFGGSQGAQAINRCIIDVMQDANLQQHINLWQQTGKATYEEVANAYQKANIDACVDVFIDDMPGAYAWADIVICRSGALSVSEIADVGVASILIPFPYAVDDHQTANAQFLVQQNAAILIQERDLKSAKLVELLSDFCHNSHQLLQMAQNARQVAKPEATQVVANWCLQEAK